MQSPYNTKEIVRIVLLNLLPFLLLILSIDDLTAAIKSPGAYPFGESINSSASIYTSQGRYIAFNLLRILLLMLFVTLSFFRRQLRRAFITVVILNVIVFLYPMLTSRD